MPIYFNGNVTINGNMEVYGDGSVRITGNQNEIHIDRLSDFIEQYLSFSSNKEEYKEAVYAIRTSSDKSLLKKAFEKIANLSRELGRNILITGLSQVAVEVLKEILNR